MTPIKLLRPMVIVALMMLALPFLAQAESGWMAEFVWSPQYCSQHHDSREVQCQQANGFVLQELVRIVDGRIADDCDEGALLSQDTVNQMARFTKNRVRTRISWQRYGRCSGLSETDYAAFAEHVDRRMNWPAGYQPGSPEQLSTTAEVIAAITGDNPGLNEEVMAMRCKRRELESITLCLDNRFELSSSACLLSSNCGESIRLRPSR